MTERSEVPEPDAEPEPDVLPAVRIRPYLQAVLPEDAAEPEADTGELPTVPPVPLGLRPFVLTSGRVCGADPAIGLETQVTARIDASSWTNPVDRLSSELQEIVALCAEPMSVAEISARLRMHLGVTKILVGDLRAAGHLDVHVCPVEDAHDPDLIMRVIDGLRAIS
ncbi:DUF742 domain-containing protein [Plantactinospora sp. B6F1]|uniref:DUF742 domain-containing protein n=1 Tax=Plantactinospora sp. B6F1 TaxID=3158971 RepID=UPI0032D97916